jgi:hypothetical protein
MSAGVVHDPDSRSRSAWVVRRPTVGEVLDLLLGVGLLVLAGVVVVGLTDRPVLWWAVAGGMVLLGVRAVALLRAPEPRRPWEQSSPAVRSGVMNHYNGSHGGPLMGGDGGGGDGGGGC